MKIILFIGMPGAGKGTQAEFLTQRNNFLSMSTGALLRAESLLDTKNGRAIKKIIDSGHLVPDELITNIISSKIQECRENNITNIILDGFPRTLQQAKNLDEILKKIDEKIEKVIYLQVDKDTVFKRLLGRCIHIASGRSYHKEFAPPKVPGIDDVTGEPLVKRNDDTEESIRLRIATFHEKTAELYEFYTQQNKLVNIDASKNAKDIYVEIKKSLNLE